VVFACTRTDKLLSHACKYSLSALKFWIVPKHNCTCVVFAQPQAVSFKTTHVQVPHNCSYESTYHTHNWL